jgi:TetR/AcrR family transcriptional regulator, transcriptional repressor for nem operon
MDREAMRFQWTHGAGAQKWERARRSKRLDGRTMRPGCRNRVDRPGLLDSWYSRLRMTEAVQELSQRKGTDTRERILDVAEAAVLEKGFAATSIDELIAAVSITKSGFFYHFRDKGELARALLARYIERENDLFDDLFRRADELNEDPLHGFLVGLKMMSEMFADLPNGHPGCLIASFCYQDRLFDKEIRQLNASAVLGWRKRFRERLELIASRYPPRIPVDLDDVADMLSVIADGGIILSRAVNDKATLAQQMLLYRDFIRALFLGT